MPGNSHSNTWAEAVNEPGALQNVYTSALIVLVVAVLLVFIGTKVLPKFKSKELNSKQQVNAILIACLVLIAIGLIFMIPLLIVPPIMIILVGILVKQLPEPVVEEEYNFKQPRRIDQLVYEGNTLNFTQDIYITVLSKHLPFYNSLDEIGKDKFIKRLHKFIGTKIFTIHDTSGFREMPILLSAAAIQLSFGFEKYLLPNFAYLHIYPEEFIGVSPTIRYLEGNVSGNTINISWKHFLNGFQYPNDGENVGLHEMAHAYHFQNFETGVYEDKFRGNFPKFNNCANKAFEQEAIPGNDLYSDYALTNFQEFWAESVEIFFEKPAELKRIYPDLYTSMCEVLNQFPS